MTTAQVVEMSVTVNNNSPVQDYVHPDDQTQPTFEMTPGFKPFTIFTLLPGNEQSGSRAGMLKSHAGQRALQLDSAYCGITIIGILNNKQSTNYNTFLHTLR